MVTLLLELGADPNSMDDQLTGLMCAAIHCNIEMVNILLKYNADVNAVNNNGGTALSYSCDHTKYKIAYRLIDMGADFNNINKYPVYRQYKN